MAQHNSLRERPRPAAPSRAARVAVAALVMAVLVGACGSGESSAPELGISAEAFTQIVDPEEDFLAPAIERRIEAWIGYVSGDTVFRLSNGSSFEYGDLNIEFHVTPYPPSEFDVSVDLIITDRSGHPADVEVTAWYDMVFMTHGQPTAEVEALGGGRYRMPLNLFMFGPWVVKTSIASAGVVDDVPLVIYVWPRT